MKKVYAIVRKIGVNMGKKTLLDYFKQEHVELAKCSYCGQSGELYYHEGDHFCEICAKDEELEEYEDDAPTLYERNQGVA